MTKLSKKMTCLLVAFAAMLATDHAHAQSFQPCADAEACAKANKEAYAKPGSKSKPEDQPGAWNIKDNKDTMTGDENVVAFIMARNSIPGMIGRPVTPTLYVRCQRNKTEVYINWERFITTAGIHGEGTHIMLRLGDDKAMMADWSMSTNFQATFAPNPTALLKAMKDKTMLRAEIVPHGSGPVRAEFEITGIPEVIKRVAKLCKWSSD